MGDAMFVLFEHPSGYALLQVKEMEEIGQISAEVEKSTADIKKFNSLVNLVAYQPFKTSISALENCNSISEGLLHEELKIFLQNNFPKSNALLGVSHSKLADSVNEELGLRTTAGSPFPEIIRATRLHFHKIIKGLSLIAENKAQIGLGHSYSRAKIKFNVHRADNMIIQSINLLDQLDKDINTFSMRVREWYGYHFPELVKLVADNPTYARVAATMGNRKEYMLQLTEEKRADLEAIVLDSARVDAIFDAAKSSMGMDISQIDLSQICFFATRITHMIERRKQLHTYLSEKMAAVAPNLSTLMGEQVSARLIAHAGSLTNLAKFPASTVQILGAEKALFRALKTRSNTPKYGLIFHSTFIGKAGKEHKGRISRYLASKATIATRIDAFSDCPTDVFGNHLKKQVEDRLTFLSSGDNPPKNAEVMALAVEEAGVASTKMMKKLKKREKKKRKEKQHAMEDIAAESSMKEESMEIETATDVMVLPNGDSAPPKKKKRVSVKEEPVEDDPTPKKKKRKSAAPADDDVQPVSAKKAKKKSK